MMRSLVSNSSKGVAACEGALERLLEGRPVVPAHVGLDPSKITAGVVSYEAGFDRGYLKKSRLSHLPLLAKIAAARQGAAKTVSASLVHNQKVLRNNLLESEERLRTAIAQRDQVLSQNLRLWERIKELEGELRQGKIVSIR